ncbi:MAG TPA: hypothetical protein VMV98_02730 [Acidobacteriaceae bacterium]|nr:hypothetical protein [Acidobacteriaceae bacterium]
MPRQRTDLLWIFRIAGWTDPNLHPHPALGKDKAAQLAGDRETAEDAIGMVEKNAPGGAVHALPEIAAQGVLGAALQLLQGSCR